MTKITKLFLGYHINEQIYAGNRTLVYRGIRTENGQPVAIKLLRNDFPRFNELVHFRNQYIIAKNLEIPGSVKAYSLETYQNHYALVMEDFGGISLSSYQANLASASNEPLEGLPVNEFLPVAIQIANALDGLYRHRVIHKDLKPANILINPVSKEVKLIDFSIASLLPRETQEIQNPNVLEGTLPYISPEQTGRMNRGIDYRTDFYSLGVTFYELLTGKLPFQTDDPMDLVHCHLAKQPLAASIINQNVPLVLSEIVSKLMAKNAEERYQSALGLKFDLETCLHEWQETGALANFTIGERDLCDRFTIPEKLYGRESEVFSLLEAFDCVSAGSTEMMLVAGFSGIGKTAVVNEVHKPIVRQRGYFIKGKFDQFQRTLPFSAFVQAFRDLMGQLLSETDAKVEQCRLKILAALGDSAGAIIEVIPELERIIGPQPPVPELSGSAAQNRFNLLLGKFLQLFTTKEHPLVIFLDDLQWADSASLKLIQLLMTAKEYRYLLLIGAYRDNEVFPAHPLMLTLAEIQKTEAKVNTITLAPLARTDVNSLVADTLACSAALALPLTELVYQKAKGNPFFSTQFLKSLHEDGLIKFNCEERYWQCDIARVRTLALTDDVVEFMALQLRKLPSKTQSVLKLAACIGNQFDLATLAIVDENSPVETASALWKALQDGLILPISEVYKFYQAEGNSKSVIGNGQESDQLPITHDQLPKYKFLHDRVQQAAYSLIPKDQKRSTHLKIGQLLLQNTPEADREERIFDIVNHLNVGVELITQEAEREQLARLNLVAGKKAKAATAYSAAVEYFKVGRALLTENSWHNQYELTLALSTKAAEVAYLSGDFEQMEKLASVVENCAKMLLDKVKVYEVQMQAYMAQNKLQEALNTGLQVLKQLGVEFPSEPNSSDIGQALGETASILSGTRIEDLIELPQMSDPYKLAAMRLLSSIFAPAYIAAPTLLPLTVCKQVQLSVQYGNASVSPFAYANYGFLLCGVVEDIDSGYQFGQLALSLVSKLNSQEIKTKTAFIVNLFIRHCKEHLRETLEPLVSAYSSGMEAGDLEYAGYNLLQSSCSAYYSGKELTILEREIARNRDAIHKIKQETALNYIEIYWQTILNLLGKSENYCLLKGEACDEQMKLPFYQQANDKAGVAYIYLNKLLLCYWFENYSEAIDNIAIAENYLDAVIGMPIVPVFHFYDSLVRLAVYSNTPELEQQKLLDRVQANQEKMQKWAHHAPMNHLHKFYLVEAERHRVLNQKIEAIEMYDKAIALAQENEYINEEALAHELAAKFYLEWGKEKLAQPYLIDAYYAYARWGAKAKIDHLEQRYPQLLAPILQQERTRQYPSETIHTSSNSESSLSNTNRTLVGSTSSWGLVDLPTVIKASQALSSEIELEQLLTTLMQVVVKNAGVQTGALILKEEGNWRINVHCTNRQDCLLQSIPVEESEVIPLTLINYVKRTKETLVFDDASNQPRFASDPYIIQQQPHSLLCTPIGERGKMMGILYLENNLATGVFTGDRVAILNILCSQAAISLQNARLYQQSQEYAQKLELYLNDLKQMQLQLVQNEKMSALGNLVAGVAHEINNPVGFIAGNLEPAQDYIKDLFGLIDLYQKKLPHPDAEIVSEIEAIDLEYVKQDLPKLIDSMNLGVERIRGISTSLRTFSRADRDYKVPFNIHEGIDSTILILKHRLKGNDDRPEIEVVKQYGNLPAVECFPGQLNQVFMNILANAIDALESSNQGRSFAEIKAKPNRITISSTQNKNQEWVTIGISDNGIGMNQEVKECIFDHLFTTKSVGKGTGLGLAIARQIVVEKHTGELEVNSALHQGTEFVILLPVKG
ncbi:trifunctional serine/threonine-protein kinase/ATP-binding protein/sensor histidine kinase [Microcoleus asticus]|uniref:histidine kinase n=1 Tax=Microcoleus asticus IPMA8 TaxID=2563858 RepID=A0ABX2D3V1_9CYAN|nr:ATP-binding sensor histidine kinase [Microcoleus asticus]NQE37334.1 Serine/threonine-protein kinase PrkC [Microcoleus asticus IPMA8]